MPLVTIIIPIYNTERYLKQCLDSVVNQTYQNLEIIVINDASTDNSLSILEDYASTYKNINLINNPTNLGVSVSRNKGLDESNGDYIYFIDSDDFIRNDTIEKMIALVLEYDVSLVEAGYKNIFLNQKNKNRKKEKKIDPFYINIKENKEVIKQHIGMACNKLYKKELIDSLRFPIHLRYEDNAFIYPLLTKAKNIVATDEKLYFYRRHFYSYMIRANLFPTMDIFDLYPVTNLIKETCIQFGTYEEYKNCIDAIICEKIYDTIIQSSTWIGIKKEDKKQILNNLYQYNRKQFDIPKIKEIHSIKKYLLSYYINETSSNKVYENSLSPAKRILSKYKR